MVSVPRTHSREHGLDDRDPAVEPLAFDVIDAEARGYVAPRRRWIARYRGALSASLAVAALITLTWLAWERIFDTIANVAADLAAQTDGRAQATATAGLAALGVLAWTMSWGRSTHPRRPVRLSGGRGRIAVDEIAGGLRGALLDVVEVRDAAVRVENRGRGRVRVHAWLRVTPQARIDDILDAADDATEWLIEDRLGVSLAEPPLVDVRYDEIDLRPHSAATLTDSREAPADLEEPDEDA